jgi:leucyl aminopeptidase
MEFKIIRKASKKHQLYIIDQPGRLRELEGLNPQELKYAKAAIGREQRIITINQYSRFLFICFLPPKKTDWQTREAFRKAGAELEGVLQQQKIEEISVATLAAHPDAAVLLAEGLALAAYRFLRYRGDAEQKASVLKTINFVPGAADEAALRRLAVITEAVAHVRTLVNEPLNQLTAEQLAAEIATLGREAGFKVQTLRKAQIEKEKMGGILAVNKGSVQPPTFTIMEYKPRNARNKQPLVLVGKGIVYDTGGLSLKPTPASMDRMKSDMSGAAVVSGAMYAIAKLELPLHVIALVPATENRPGGDAYVPGDVIRMYSGATVEVLNTDAEGRLVLADALHWAKRYQPELVLDFATLTGAASVAVGEHGIVCMGTAEEPVKQALRESGFRQYERLVEYPLWEEYGEMIKSEIADLKNIGGPSGGAITAGKFLEYFTDYPWMHFDIAGVSFATAKKNYIPAGGTGYGLRMLLDFLAHYESATPGAEA